MAIPAIGLLLPVLVLGPEPEQARPLAVSGSFHAISVRDLDAMVSWYVAELGFTVDSSGENESRKGALLSRPGVLLELAQFRGARSRAEADLDVESHEIHGIFKLGFRVEDLEAAFAQVERRGLDLFFPIVRASDASRTFGIRDPEGNIIQFFGE